MTAQPTTTLVTGASSGIGEQFALQLGRRGHHLVLTARSEDKMHALAQRLRSAHPGIDVNLRTHVGTTRRSFVCKSSTSDEPSLTSTASSLAASVGEPVLLFMSDGKSCSRLGK